MLMLKNLHLLGWSKHCNSCDIHRIFNSPECVHQLLIDMETLDDSNPVTHVYPWPRYMWVVKHQEDSSRPFVLHIHLWIDFHQSIQLAQGIHTNHLAHITWVGPGHPLGALDPGGFKDVMEKCEMILVEKKKTGPNMETEKWREKAGYKKNTSSII